MLGAYYARCSVITPGSGGTMFGYQGSDPDQLLYSTVPAILSCCIITLDPGGCDLCNCQLPVYNEAPREQALCLQLQKLNRNHYVC